ncbi:MAG: potassium transporter [Proteobacteria bacterium]|nr:potassium transporter [Pseudomonadota bacterium]
MQIAIVLRVLSILLMMFSFSMVPPLWIADWYGDSPGYPFLIAFGITFFSGVFLWALFHKHYGELKTRDGFLVVILFWFVLCSFAALPLMIADYPHLNFTDAMLESVSGFTTTGATILRHIDELPRAMLYYRQQLEFLGGMGIVVLAVAILPMIGVGGMQLFRAETPGPMKNSKMTPRITETAKRLWYIYLGLTVICAFAYWVGGMSVFNAIGESFATISTGGFSMHDANFAYYNSTTLEMIASVFMILGGINFSLHYLAIRNYSLKYYWEDEEFKMYLLLLVAMILIVFVSLMIHRIYAHPLTSLTKSIFNVISMVTTTGYISAPFATWPGYVPVLIIFGTIIGGCAASTSGGIKVIRALLMVKETRREIHRLMHPQSIATLKFGKQILPEPVLQAMWAFIAAFLGLFIFLMLILLALGLDFETAFGTIAACISNTGTSIGQVSDNFAKLSDPCKWVMIFAMLLGRLEIFTLLVILSPDFWRK